MRQWYWGYISSIAWKARPTGICVLADGPKLAFGQPVVKIQRDCWMPSTSKAIKSPLLPPPEAKEPYLLLYIFFKPGALWNHPSSSSIIPFSSNLQRKCRTAPSSFQAARRPARMTCQPTSPPRRTSPLTTRCLLIIVLRGAPRRRTWRRRTMRMPTPMMTMTTLTPTLTLTHLLPSERCEHI